jgi:hypothetical protein
MRNWTPFAVLSLLLLASPGASAGQPAAIAKPRFEQFCASWMGKLQAREKVNLASAQVERRGKRFVIEYTGYGSKPLRCETKATGVPQNPFVGKLVYKELRYQKAAKKAAAARGASPSVVAITEILEIFRFDGSRWVY